jgi:hypothetical protein
MSITMRTQHRARHGTIWLPAGMVVQTVSRTLTGGPGHAHSRDGATGGDGQRLRVKYPSGVVHGEVRMPGELAGLGIVLADLEETR